MATRLVSFTLKALLGVLLLAAVLLWNDNWKSLDGIFAGIEPAYLPLPFIATFVLLVVSCLKWNLFLRQTGVNLPFRRLVSLYLIGMFFNNFLPGTFGGDVVRGFVLGRQINSQAQSAMSVVMERVTGLIALAILSIVCIAFQPELLSSPIVAGAVAALAAGCLVFIAMFVSPALGEAMIAPLNLFGRDNAVVTFLRKLNAQIGRFRTSYSLLAGAMAYSFLFHVLAGVNVYVSAMAIGVELDFLATLALTPIILVISSIPITTNGIGLWEWAYSLYLVPAGASAAEGLAVALTIRAAALLTSLLGGLLFALERGAHASAPEPGERSPPTTHGQP
ncbi:MAG: flippase-like domain-containing protein [Alphaproteobacteria bacterium]|nr:flippase-like domain-containing protein [Alphaproteobacteria bacterium]